MALSKLTFSNSTESPENFYEYLLVEYGKNQPILIERIERGGYSRQWLFKQIKELVDSGKLIRFDTGVYYIPTDMLFGPSLLNSRRVIELKYLTDGDDIYGYYTGITLRNGAGLTTQMPNVLEIVTNNETAKVREVLVGTQKIRTRKPRTKITTGNVNALQFLELMNLMGDTALDDTERSGLKSFISKSDITIDDVMTYVPLFPAKAMKNMMESGVIYELTQ